MTATASSLDAIVRLADFESLGRLAVDRAVYDYVAGGSWDEDTLAENDAAWHRRRLRPRVLVDVSSVDASTTMLGTPVAMPVAIAPVAAHGLVHADGELATVRGAAAAGVPFTLSTMSSRSIEEVADAAPDAIRWFQLYAQADPGRSRSLIERAAAAGYRAIVLTVDLPRLGYRERDLRNVFDILDVPLGNFADAPPSHRDPDDARPPGDGPTSGLPKGRLTWDDISSIRSWSTLPLVIKGIMTGEDAELACEAGVAGIVVSNHGARQLDRVAAPVDVLEEVVDAVTGRAEIWVDGGVRRGLDVTIALALGARGVLVGRPVLWALAAHGEAGVTRALAIIRVEFEIAMALLGASTPSELTRAHVGPAAR